MQTHSGTPLESDAQIAPGDRGDEDLYQDEFDAGRRHDLEVQLAAVQRAEARPTAEFTIEEQQDQGG